MEEAVKQRILLFLLFRIYQNTTLFTVSCFSMTVLLTEDYLASFITPPPPAEFLSGKTNYV